MTRLSVAEHDIMKVVWENQPPITNAIIMEQVGNQKGWKAPTALTLLGRLVDKGFLSTEKVGKERHYFPMVSRAEYLAYETKEFMKHYHDNSLSSLVTALNGGVDNSMSDKEVQELLKLITNEGE